MIINHCQTGWFGISSLLPDVQKFAHSCVHFIVCDGLLIYGSRIVVSSSLRTKILDAFHNSHQGVVKSPESARSSIWWPKIGKDIERVVASCLMCANYRTPPAEPLLSSSLPDLPWQKVATDLFELNGKHFLIVIDFFPRFIELIELRLETADCVITALKSIFASHGIPAVVCSDNGPCYAAEFSTVRSNLCFFHTTYIIVMHKEMVRLKG